MFAPSVADTPTLPEETGPTVRGSNPERLQECGASTRPQLEDFIRHRFAEVYGAHLYSFMPRLFGMNGKDGALHAAFGLRSAVQGPLFLERYLDLPIENAIAEVCKAPVARSEIAEIGNLAGARPGALRELIPLLTRMLHAEGYRWVVFTGSSRLCNGFSRLGLPLEVLAEASVDRLPEDERALWGTYYQHAPSVMLGDVLNGFRFLQALAEKPQALRAALSPVAGIGAP